MKLENACLCVEIAEKGAELTRIFNKKTGAETCGTEILNFGTGILRSCSQM